MAMLVLSFAAHAGSYTERAITQAVAGGTLYGTELIPEGEAKVPVVLLHSGSGPTDRDGNSEAASLLNNSLRMLAESLARQGIATVRYDKRGVASSAGAVKEESDLRLDGYVDDAVVWMRQLRADQRFSRVVMAGHSEGALIALVACQRAKADACVSISGSGHPLADILRDQLKPKLPPALAGDNERILVSLEQGKPVEEVPPQLMMLYRPSVQPYLISSFKTDPRKAIAALKMPVLILQGTTDIQVAVTEAQALSAAAPAAKLVIIDGMNHVLKMVPADPARQRDSYSNPDLPLAPQLGEAVATFVKQR
ncbi:pimeloyl-ACP methyl ester carboxylesterase [Duganella sp. 1411]|uniref:alpha/beta hydrolase n=1 Tax=Duganella sp. 1411 TaxID=2806572 RepID=UPI001B404968|nr:alpha/beta fold hydrolase [Duganella sp. 1411]MBP1203967.1 pimeloyl-ACP methyl ester carboxylesterase [Duganella sp. 1411]